MTTNRHTCPTATWPHCPKCDAGQTIEEILAESARKRTEWTSHGHNYDNPEDDWHLL